MSCCCEHLSQLSAIAFWKLLTEKKYLGQVQTCILFKSCQSKTVADPAFISLESTPRCTSSSKDVLNEVWLTSLLCPSHHLPSIPEGASWVGQEFGLGGFGCAGPLCCQLAMATPCCCLYNSHVERTCQVLLYPNSPLLPRVVVAKEEGVSLF